MTVHLFKVYKVFKVCKNLKKKLFQKLVQNNVMKQVKKKINVITILNDEFNRLVSKIKNKLNNEILNHSQVRTIYIKISINNIQNKLKFFQKDSAHQTIILNKPITSNILTKIPQLHTLNLLLKNKNPKTPQTKNL